MSESPARFVARHVHDLIDRQRLDALPDHALLRRFLDGDEAAFAALVRRHGPLVLGTCRRILRHAQDAEDACQAVFLVLARKGGTVRGESLAGWLHRVAVRAASRLRRLRRNAEPLPNEIPASDPAGDELVWREVRQTFDAEVGRLPARLRLPLVLCCLQGKSRTEAAAELGWTEGTVRGRLERGRKLLRSRFTRRGLTLPAALLPLLIEEVAPATTPAVIASPSTAAARLADAVVRSMALARAKLAVWATAAVLVAGTAVGLGVHGPASAQPKVREAPATAPAAPPVTAADAERNLDTFVLRVSLAPAGKGKFDPKYSLYSVLLYVPNLRLEPPAAGPDGKPTEAFARITREEARKILAVLEHEKFFTERGRTELPVRTTGPHATLALRYQGGDDPTGREVVYPWDASMLKALDALRVAVTGEAAKALDRLLAQLADERRKWALGPLADDLKKLQGAWAMYVRDEREVIDPNEGPVARCTFDGKGITFKARIQYKPLLDLETIRGTFELADGSPRKMVIKGVRDTIARQEPGTWTVPYEFVGNQLRFIFPSSRSDPPSPLEPDPKKGERLFIMTRQSAGPVSDWGEASNGVQTRIRASKARYGADEIPTFDLDVRDTHTGPVTKPWQWVAPRIGQVARVEVDGVWYVAINNDLSKVISHQLGLGQTVEKWATVLLTADFWATEATAEMPARKLVLRPGKHKVRVGYYFSPSGGGVVPASPVSGPVEIEILPAKAVGHMSDWGEPTKGLRTRLRTTTLPGSLGDERVIALDVKADPAPAGGQGVTWSAGRAWHMAKLEVDGVWYVARYRTYEYVMPGEVGPGQEISTWVTIRLDSPWVAEKTRNDKSPRALDLNAGKHTLRVKYTFWNGSPPTESVSPISGPLEIDVPAPAGKAAPPAAGPWRAKATWHPHGTNAVRYLGVAPDERHLYTADKDGVTLWDVSGPEPKAEQKVGYTIDGLQFAGLDRDGLPLLLRQSVRRQPNEAITDLTVFRLPDMGENVKPQFAVPTDTVRQWAVRRDGKALALGSAWWDSVRLVDLGTGKDRTLERPKGSRDQLAFLHRLMFSRDGKTLVGLGSNEYPVTGRMNGLVVCWDAESGKVVWQVAEAEGQGAGALSADGRTLVTGWRLGKVATVWHLATGKKLREIPTNGAEAIGLSADGKTVVIGTYTEGAAREPILEIWDLAGKTAGQRLSVPTNIRFVSVRDDGRAFAAADVNGAVGWWVREK